MAGRKKAKPTKRTKVAAQPKAKRVTEPRTVAAEVFQRKLEEIIRRVVPDYKIATPISTAPLDASWVDATLAAITDDFAATRERIRQIEAKALEKLMRRRRKKP